MNEILIHLWLAFFLVTFCGCFVGIRRLDRRRRIARGERK
jgi:hypothetical protein